MRKTFFRQLLPVCCLVLAGVFALSLAACSDAQEPTVPTYKTGIDAKEILNAPFAKQFPKEFATYERNKEDTIMTEYKGSVPYRKNDIVDPIGGVPGDPHKKGFKHAQPYLKNLWLGYPFSYEYNETRGHVYAIEDILRIDRINRYGEAAGLPATCWNCKATTIPKWVEEAGKDEKGNEKFWAMNFNEFRTADKINMSESSIGCANCHNPTDMTLAITSFPLAEALQRQGIDWKTLPRNEMRSLVCAQCHVEYYFTFAKYGADKKPVFPWDHNTDGSTVNGKDPANIYTYYDTHGVLEEAKYPGMEGKFHDWIHPVSDVPMIKVQHPEFETWYDGPHGAAGVSCADCHMPYTRIDGSGKVSSHHWTSPLKSPESIDNACRQCHNDKTADYLKTRVEYTQKRTYEQLIIAQDLSVKAHEAVRLANAWSGMRDGNYVKNLAIAKEGVRKGQFYWDFISAENSVGFHNPAKALETLALSMEASQAAIDAAMVATNYEIGPALQGNIRTIVPPILEWSRAMQMDQANLDMHVWTTYLKPLPKADLMWDVQTKLR